VGKNLGNTTTWDGYTEFTAPGLSKLHPNPNQIVVVSWLAPSSGSVRVEFRVTDGNAGNGDGVDWYVDKGDITGNLASGVLNNGGGTSLRVLPSVRVSAGERINFIVDPKNGDHGWDATRLYARISYNPAPSDGPQLAASVVDNEYGGKNMRVTFDTQTGFLYSVEYTEVLPATEADWQSVYNGTGLPGTGASMSVDDVDPWGLSAQRFYRVRME
jgi:hypothetical protein